MAKSKHQKTAAWVFGSVFVVFLIVVYFVTPGASLHHPIIRLIGALLAGLFGYFVTGSIKLVANAAWSPLGKLTIQAGGGAAMFVLVYFGWSQFPGPSPTGGQQVEIGSIAENLHRAIEMHERVLAQATTVTPKWADTQINLGIGWANLPTGVFGKFIERAMECYTAALVV